jgi:flap endonuclease-1
MGTSGFWSFYSSLIKTIPINQIKGKVAFIDIILYIHKYVIGIRKSGSDIKSKNGKNIIHLFALTKILKNFTDQNILPVCVFDGKSPLIKSELIEKRREIIETSKEKCEELKKNNDVNTEEYIKYFRRSFSITHELLNECRDYIKLTGLPYINSIGEADPQCAALSYYYTNISSGVFSEDSDILLYGAKSLLRNLDNTTNCVSVIYSEDILNYLQEKSDYISINNKIDQKEFTRENLIDFSIIMGNDYCQGIRCIGNNNREKIFELFVLAQYNVEIFKEMIEIINMNKFTYIVPENFIKKWKEIREVYINSFVINPSNIDITMNKPNYNQLRNFLEYFSFRNDVIVHISDSLRDLYSYFNGAINIKNNKKIDDEWTYVGKNRKIRYDFI